MRPQIPGNGLSSLMTRIASSEAATQLKLLADILGLLQRDPREFLQGGDRKSLSEAQINEQIAARIAARQTKDYAEADRIRKELLNIGITLEDTPQGTTWRHT